MKSTLPDRFKQNISNLRVGMYTQDSTALFVATADIPSGSQRHADQSFRRADGTDSSHQVSVPSGFGGSVRCQSTLIENVQVPTCAWVDNGTFGLVMALGSDEGGAISLLTTLRNTVEH
jgi:hypothetical protein